MFGIGISKYTKKELEAKIKASWNPLETMRLLVELEKLKS